MTFWQTARTARRARPGQRVPARRASELERLTIEVESRECYPYRFAGRPVERCRRALPVGDYGDRASERLIACVEKTLEDLSTALVDGSLNYALPELAALPAAAIVVEERYGALLSAEDVRPDWLLELVARPRVRDPAVPIVFADSRKLAEEWARRFLTPALVHPAPEHAHAAGESSPPAS